MRTHLLVFVLALPPFAAFPMQAAAAAEEPTLTAEDKKYLDDLMKEFLFDPKGAARVTVTIKIRTVWATAGEAQADGWYVPGKGGEAGRVFFTDGEAVAAPPEKEMKKVDFAAACESRYAAEKKDGPDHFDETFRRMRRTAVGVVEDDDLALAAWLYRLGHEALAAKALAAARKGEGDPRQRLRVELAWSAFAGMVHAYMVRADEEALADGERLLRLYADEAKEETYGQARPIVEDLKRRQKSGTFGKAPPDKPPDGFAAWDAKKQTAYLIDALEEVDARQWGQPGGVDLASDWRVAGLVGVGDAAVPDLIDALEKDRRLTRSVHFWRDFARQRTVLSVREAALTALMSILRVRVFEPASTGDSFTARGDDEGKDTARRLRAYWKEYGGLPFDERMMKVLTDPRAKFEARREAAENLATLNEGRPLQTTITVTVIGGDAPSRPNPAVEKFKDPTAADAILAAMDADLKDFDAGPADGLTDYRRRQLEEHYVSALVRLGDKRIAGELSRRSRAAESVRMRRQWAYAAHWLGDPEPFRSYAADFRLGKIRMPANDRPQTNDSDQPGYVELRGAIGFLTAAGTPEADRALYALADPKHPYYALIADRLRKESVEWSDSSAWFAHPYCLAVFRRQLDDTTPTGAVYTVEKDLFFRREKDGYRSEGVPEFLADPAVRRDRADERACDAAAEKLNKLVVGLPRCQPLLKDADERLATMKATLDRFSVRFRRLSYREARILGVSVWSPTYIADMPPLGRAATADDVKAGKAIFHLDGKGKPADLPLPAAAVLKRDERKQRPPGVLIMQAEVGQDGETTYGIVAQDGIRAVPQRDLTNIKTFAELDKEEKDAARKAKGDKN